MGWFQKEDRNLTDYERYSKLSPSETMQNRDVYNGQQPNRTHFKGAQSPLSRHVLAGTLTVLVVVIAWIFISVVSWVNEGGLFTSPGGWANPNDLTFGAFIATFTFGKFIGTATIGFLFFVVMDTLLMKNKEAQDMLQTTDDINQYENDQHIAYPEELQRKFDYFPDVGATSDVQFSSMISHVALSNKGLKTVQVAKRADKDIVDEDGEVVLYKGEVLRDDDGNILTEEKPLLDKAFMESLFDASGLPKNTRDAAFRVYYDTRHIPYNPGNILTEEKPLLDKAFMESLFDASGLPKNTRDAAFRVYYDTRHIPYNPGNKNRDKLQNKEKPYDTVADLINADWQLPYYEPQRPAGAYLVDTAPVNTMVKHMFAFA